MATLNRDSIDTFISITGVPESIAVQRLEACGGNLNEAINVHFSEGNRNRMQETPATVTDPPNDFMDIDDSLGMEHRGPSSLASATRELNPFSHLDPAFRRDAFDSGSRFGCGSDLTGRATFVSPLDDSLPGLSGSASRIEDDDTITRALRGNKLPASNDGPSAPQFDDTTAYGNDIEEEMIRAAIEASKRDADVQNKQQELCNKAGTSGSNVHEPAEMEKRGKIDKSSGRRRGARASDKRSRQRKKEAASSSIQNDIEETNEHSLARHRDRSSGSEDAGWEVEEAEVRPVLGPSRSANSSLTQPNGNSFPSDEWGGISSEEHDEAVMLEAAMFGRVPENGYPLPYATPQRLTRSRLRNLQSPRPPSPTLVAQRTIREQQDGEYFAALQADREKELRAMEEEKAAKEAALLEQRQREEESQRKLAEEQELERQLAAKEASLPEEPPLDDENAVNLLVRMPNGSRRGRRFHKTDRLEFLFDFIDIGRGVKPGTYRLVRPYPRRAFSGEEKSLTLSELGLTSKQEALFLEMA